MKRAKKATANNGQEYNVKRWLSETTFRDERGIIRSIKPKPPSKPRKKAPKKPKKAAKKPEKPEVIYRRGNRFISSKSGFVKKEKYSSYVRKTLEAAYSNTANRSEKKLVNQSLKTSIFETVSSGKLAVLNVEGRKIIVDKGNIEKVNKLIDDVLKSYYNSSEARQEKKGEKRGKRETYHIFITKETEFEEFKEFDLDTLLDNEFLPDETIEEIYEILNQFANEN